MIKPLSLIGNTRQTDEGYTIKKAGGWITPASVPLPPFLVTTVHRMYDSFSRDAVF